MAATSLMAGIAAEHLVCTDIIMSGHNATMAAQSFPYDVLADVGGTILRVQVKSTGRLATKRHPHHADVHRWVTNRRGRDGSKSYADDDFDLLALVATGSGSIAYTVPKVQRRCAIQSSRMAEHTLAAACASLGIDLTGSAVTDLTLGMAAEHLVCAQFLLGGRMATLTDQMFPYDVLVEDGGSPVRVQVKATRGPRPLPQRRTPTLAYQWSPRRARASSTMGRIYTEGEFDLLALAAMDVREVAYLPALPYRQVVHLRPPDHDGPPGPKTILDHPLEQALESLR